MSLKYPTFTRSLDTTYGSILFGIFGSLEHAKLTAIKSAFGLDIIQSTLLCQNTFGPRKSNLQPLLTKGASMHLYQKKTKSMRGFEKK